jgi:hypothetical protein
MCLGWGRGQIVSKQKKRIKEKNKEKEVRFGC